jgi:DNA-binding transcriptional LysR family regulator
MRFDLTDLRLFLAVAEAGSITHGAAEAGLSLPAASERLREMEVTGEVAFLDRGRRGVTLTEAGEALAHHARTILQQMAQMRGEIGLYAKGLRAAVRMHANTAAMVELLPAKLASWMAANPQIDIELKERQSVEIARSIAAGFADLGVLSSAVDTRGLTLRPFAIDRLVVVTSPQSFLAERRDVYFEELLASQFIGLNGGALQSHIDAQAARHGVKLKRRISLRSFDGICRMASQGVGIGIVPEIAAQRAKRSAPVSVVRLRDDWATRRLSVCVRQAGQLSPAAHSLLNHLAESA